MSQSVRHFLDEHNMNQYWLWLKTMVYERVGYRELIFKIKTVYVYYLQYILYYVHNIKHLCQRKTCLRVVNKTFSIIFELSVAVAVITIIVIILY